MLSNHQSINQINQSIFSATTHWIFKAKKAFNRATVVDEAKGQVRNIGCDHKLAQDSQSACTANISRASEQCQQQKRVKQSKQTYSNINPSSVSPMIMTHAHCKPHTTTKLYTDAQQDVGQVEQLLGRLLGFLTSKESVTGAFTKT